MQTAMQFPLGTPYLIINADNNQALRIQSTTPEEFNKSRIISADPNPNDLAQYFMVEKTGLEEDSYEIVNCISGFVFDEESKQIRLKKGKQVSDQLFKLQNIKEDWYWIKCEEEGETAVCLQGILRYKQFDPNDPHFIFRFARIQNPPFLRQACVLCNKNSGKALDVPASTFQPDTRIIQFSVHKRFNQYWRFVKSGSGFLIQSLLNGLVLDIANESTQGGSPVIQWTRTGSSNQLWIPQRAGQRTIKIGSVHAPGMFLCIKGQSVKDFGKLQIWDQENPSMYWEVLGQMPC